MENKKIMKDPEMGEIQIIEDFDYSQVKIVITPGKKITFEKYPQSAVKSLEVNIYSIDSEDVAILHKLHSQTRNS